LSPRHGASQVADGGDGLQIWRVAANIMNKQPRTAYTGLTSSLGVGSEAKILLTVKNKFVTKCHKRPRTWTDSLGVKLGFWH
jgi:hypothetical protein